MARIAAQIKLGYFPLPPEIAIEVGRRLKPPTVQAVAFDPCCGTGEALCLITDNQKFKLQGVEVDEVRAAAARIRLGADAVLNSPFENVYVRGECQLLYLNPPYEHEVGVKKRVEVSFLQNSLDCLATGGILVFVVPHRVLSRALDELVGSFRRLSVFKGDERFGQSIVFGIKRGENERPLDGERQTFLSLIRKRYADLPDIGDKSSAIYQVPDAPEGSIFQTKSAGTDFSRLEQSFVSSQCFKSLTNSGLCPPPRTERPLRIIHPLTPGMIAVLLQGGFFDGQIYSKTDNNCSVVKGATILHRIRNEEEISKYLRDIARKIIPLEMVQSRCPNSGVAGVGTIWPRCRASPAR